MASVGFQDSQKTSINFSLSLENGDEDDLSQRIEEYKHQNPEDVEELKRCIHDVLGEAERTAQERLDKKAVSSGHEWKIFQLLSSNIPSAYLWCDHGMLTVYGKIYWFSLAWTQLQNRFLHHTFFTSSTDRWSEREKSQCIHVGLERQEQAGCDARPESRTFPHRHYL